MSDTPRTKGAARMGFMEQDMLRSVFVVPLKVAEELERELATLKAERDAAREDLDRTQRVLAKIDAVRAHQSEKLVSVYEASGAEPGHFDRLDIFVGVMRRLIDAVEAMGYEWRWTKSIDENGEQVGAWVMRDAAEADANNKAWRTSDGE
jgi:hypothetical protein